MSITARHIARVAAMFAVLFAVNSAALSGKSEKTADKQAELSRVQKQIEETQRQLQALDKKETNQSRALGTFTKQKQKIQLHLAALGAEKSALQDSIAILRKFDKNLTVAQQTIRKHFSAYLRNYYVASSVSPAQNSVAKVIYTSVLTRKVRDFLHDIDRQHDSVSSKRREFDSASKQAAALLQARATEGKTLETSINQTKATLAEIRADKELMRRELTEKQRSAEKIRVMVARLIEEENRREEERKRKLAEQKAAGKLPKTGADTPEKTSKTVATFRWPVASRKIARKFGQYSNAQTNTVMDNPGIDIAAKTGTSVTAAAAGEVSLVHWLPGYNSLIIVDHGNGYRTVYANLTRTLAIKGQSVTAGAVIGKTGESADGQFLHFEVWRGTEKVNPVQTLK